MPNIVYVAFYTKDTPYETIAENYLLPTLCKHGLYSRLSVVQDRGKWIKNIAYKPKLIEDALMEYPGHTIVYIDVDARIEEYPILFEQIPPEYDAAFHTLDHDAWYGKTTGEKEVFNGTIMLRSNPAVKAFVRKWIDACTNEAIGEHRWFEKLMNEDATLKKYPLPLEYAYITSLPDGRSPLVKVDKPVIAHHQASRKFRHRL
jgi:hypothetical protein